MAMVTEYTGMDSWHLFTAPTSQ